MLDYARTFGPRTDDGEWAAAEYISLFRTWGNIYVSQTIHGDTQYLYRVDMTTDPTARIVPWVVSVFEEEGDTEKYTKLVKTVTIGAPRKSKTSKTTSTGA